MPNNSSIVDYKIHSFNGEPRLILVCQDRFSDTGLTEDFFDIEWKHLDIRRADNANSSNPIRRPILLEKMIDFSRMLSNNSAFLRTDFYVINGQIYFGELTFYPASGFRKFIPESIDAKLGDMLSISMTL